MDVSFKKPKVTPKPQARSSASYLPIALFSIKDMLKEFASHKNFPDAIAIDIAIISVALAFPFFPPIILIPLLVVTFALTLLSPLGGLMAMLFETLAMFVFQVPLLAWILTLFISVALFIGHRHYRTITFIYVLIMLPLSAIGSLFEIPAFMIGVLFLGHRRAIVSTVIILLMLPILFGLTGVQNSAPIAYNAALSHGMLQDGSALQYLTPSKPMPDLSQFPSAFAGAIGSMFSFSVAGQIFNGFGLAVFALSYGLEFTAIQLFVWLIVVFAIVDHIIKSRSAYKGTEASLLGLVMLVAFILIDIYNGSVPGFASMLSFVLAPVIIFSFENSNIQVAQALEVMKKDFMGKFGEAFEDLTSGSRESLNDIADYTETKKELTEAVIAPIEHREISGAYHIKPTKGILLFGPPGTGKTMLMRAIANEVRARFFYVKTSSLMSPFQGESAQALSKVFDTARKNAPSVLFFDEIDGIASKREIQESDISRQLLTTLLGEMDGFQKIDGVVIVGSTNAPNLLDESILRPGRFDKIIYMPLPDREGRALIFKQYLKKLPAEENLDYDKLADLTNRYTGADIKNVCEEAARQVADDAVRQHKVLKITMQDIVGVIKATKPSTSLAAIDRYNQFRVDYERRLHPELAKAGDGVMVSDVVGLGEAKKALYEAVEIPILHPNLMKKYDVQDIRGILLFGPPGTGKTMLMKAVANELEGVKLLVLSGSEVSKNGVENALGEIRDVFNRARENTPCIIFIDEIDALMSSRDKASEFSVQVVSEFLQQLDGIRGSSGVVLVGVTNRPDMLDSAIIRPGRIDKFIFVPPPRAQDRAQLFKYYLSRAPLVNGIDFMALAGETEGYTGADIANICREAKMAALEADITTSKEREITLADLLKVVRSVKPSAPPDSMHSYMSFLSIYGGR